MQNPQKKQCTEAGVTLQALRHNSRAALEGKPMNTTETNRQTAIDFYTRFDAGDTAGVLALMADDCAYWLAGVPGSNATAGLRTKAEMADIFSRMAQAMTGPLRMTVHNTVAEGDQVAVMAESRALPRAVHAARRPDRRRA
eukprot:gene90-119_t